MSHSKAIETLRRFTLLPSSKASLVSSFTLLYLEKTGLEVTEDAYFVESMKGVVSRTQDGKDLGWDFETGFILTHAAGQRKIVLRSSHADLQSIRYFIEVEDIDPKSQDPIKLRVTVPIDIKQEEDLDRSLAEAATQFEQDKDLLH
nr:hypothetical protein [uncultured Cohaesibacter sp.]